ncbi:MAG: hypothetical protein L6R36_002906 [Xanthoria steineri]|nr:MAG: hypothetical protein L6R36_002906 [Xanthoria steineri]
METCTELGPTTDIHLTLPLARDFDPSAMEKAIGRSRSRWHWFTEGQRRNPALGTLSYLPVEIRWLIWQQLAGGATWQELVGPTISCCDPWYCRHQNARDWFFDNSRVVGVSYRDRKQFGMDHGPSFAKHVRSMVRDLTPRVPVPVLRKGVPLAGLEFDEMYLATTTLEVDHHRKVNDLLTYHITPWQLPWIRHLSFVLNSQDDGWLPFFRRQLPPNLRTVMLDLKHDQHLQPYNQYQEVVDHECEGRYCTVGKHRATKTILANACKHIHQSRFWAKKLERDIGLFKDVALTLTRDNPLDNPLTLIQLGKENFGCRLCHGRCRRILDKVKQIWPY